MGKGKPSRAGRAAASKAGKTTSRAAARLPEVDLTKTTRLGQIMALPAEVIWLHLDQHHLTNTGNKREVEGCLFDTLQGRNDDNSSIEESGVETGNPVVGNRSGSTDGNDQPWAKKGASHPDSDTDSDTDTSLIPTPLRASQIHATI